MVTDELYRPYKSDKLALFQNKLSPTAKLPYYGISMPNLRGLARGIDCSDIEIKWHEDVILCGLALGLEKTAFSCKIDKLNKILPYLSSWDHTDSIVTAFKPRPDEKRQLVEYFSSLTRSDETFIRRLGIVWLMANRNNIDYEEALKTIIKADNGDDYYVMMAVSWALSFYALDGRDISQELEKVSETTKTKTLQKLRESKRTNKNLSIEIVRDRKTN